jgi:hypothetical protein
MCNIVDAGQADRKGSRCGENSSVPSAFHDQTNYHTATKTFSIYVLDLNPAEAVRVDPAQAFYATIGDACQGADDGCEIKSTTLDFPSLLCNLERIVTLTGGYTADFSGSNSMTSIIGTLTIGNGQVTIRNSVIK